MLIVCYLRKKIYSCTKRKTEKDFFWGEIASWFESKVVESQVIMNNLRIKLQVIAIGKEKIISGFINRDLRYHTINIF